MTKLWSKFFGTWFWDNGNEYIRVSDNKAFLPVDFPEGDLEREEV